VKNKNLASAVLSVLLLSSITSAQSGDWQAVTDLPPGIEISVKSEHSFRIPCILERASEKELVCEYLMHGPRGAVAARERIYERKTVREVRLERGNHANIATGAVIGGAAGAAVGANVGNGPHPKVVGALLLGGLGAVFGGIIAKDFIPNRGKLIYRR
jgi:hypothetical protein